jgi:hypothetical protein
MVFLVIIRTNKLNSIGTTIVDGGKPPARLDNENLVETFNIVDIELRRISLINLNDTLDNLQHNLYIIE